MSARASSTIASSAEYFTKMFKLSHFVHISTLGFRNERLNALKMFRNVLKLSGILSGGKSFFVTKSLQRCANDRVGKDIVCFWMFFWHNAIIPFHSFLYELLPEIRNVRQYKISSVAIIKVLSH